MGSAARIKKFYKCANAIFRIEGRSDDFTMLRIVKHYMLRECNYSVSSVPV